MVKRVDRMSNEIHSDWNELCRRRDKREANAEIKASGLGSMRERRSEKEHFKFDAKRKRTENEREGGREKQTQKEDIEHR